MPAQINTCTRVPAMPSRTNKRRDIQRSEIACVSKPSALPTSDMDSRFDSLSGLVFLFVHVSRDAAAFSFPLQRPTISSRTESHTQAYVLITSSLPHTRLFLRLMPTRLTPSRVPRHARVSQEVHQLFLLVHSSNVSLRTPVPHPALTLSSPSYSILSLVSLSSNIHTYFLPLPQKSQSRYSM